MGQYNKYSLKSIFLNILLVIVLALLLLIPAYFCYKFFIENIDQNTKGIENENTDKEDKTPTDNTNEDSKPIEGDPYVEYFPIIEEQQAYVVAPTAITKDAIPTLILYNHGSNTNVTQNMEDQFMKDLKGYGILFTEYNYIFAASNEHDVNWGNSQSIQDMYNLIEWVKSNYNIQPKVYLLGFSMGGLPTMNFATKYPELVSKIALLAPTTRSSEWNQTRADKVRDMEIKIWHGTKDVNVPFSSSTKFVNTLNSYGIKIEFEQIQGKTHFDLDTEYTTEILLFFES